MAVSKFKTMIDPLQQPIMHLSIASPAPGDPGIAGIRAGTYKLPM